MVAQNSPQTTPARPAGRPFTRGVSGNPGGRPKGLRGRIRDATNDGHDLVDYVVGVFTDDAEPTKMRMEAVTWLADRGFGKPPLPPDEERRPPMEALPENLEELEAQLAALEARWVPDATRARELPEST